MATIVTRVGKGSALSTAEMDANFTNLNTDKIELTNLSVTTAADGETSALSYNNTTGVLTFTPVVISDLIGLTDLSVGAEAAASGDGAIAYDNTTGVFTYTPPTAAGIGALANVVEDTSPQLGGNLDLQTYNITTSTTNGSIGLAPNGTGAVNILTGSGLNIAATAGEAKIFTTSTNANIRLSPDGTGVVKVDKDIDLEAKSIVTSTTNGNITLTPNGTGKIAIAGGGGIDLKDAAAITTSSAATDIDVTATGYINLNSSTVFGAGIEETVYVAPTSGTYAPASANGTIHYVALTGNMTINAFTNPVAGQTISLLFDGTGGSYTLTLGADILKPAGTLALTTGGMDVVTITCVDDVTPVYIATAVNDFQ